MATATEVLDSVNAQTPTRVSQPRQETTDQPDRVIRADDVQRQLEAKQADASRRPLPSGFPERSSQTVVEEITAEFQALEAGRRRLAARHCPSGSSLHPVEPQTESGDEFGRTVPRDRVDEEVEEGAGGVDLAV